MSEELNNTDSTTFTSKESVRKLSSNEKNKNPINNTSYSHNIKFKEPNHKLEWKDYIQNTYHFKQDIERIYSIIKNFEILCLLNGKNHYPCIIIKGQTTWDIGNQFIGNIFGKYPFVAKVNKSINLPEMKKIEWLFNIHNGEYFIIRMELLKVTEDNTCIVLNKIKFESLPLKNEAQEIFDKNNKKNLFKIIEEFLETEPINLLKYESCIISAKMEDIWNLILDFNQLTAIAPNNNFLPNINIKELEIGVKTETSIFKNNEVEKFFITLKYKDERPGWNKWLFICECSGENISRAIFLFQLTKINETECQLTLITKFNDPIDNNKFNKISENKQYLLLSLKDFFENYYSPNS